MSTVIRRNERSWAIELISKINEITKKYDLVIKKAGGESTISTNENTMFPDVILYGDQEQNIILEGWELKMPDVLIENEEFIKDAQRKAIALNLNSCLIWNFTYAVLYVRKKDNSFSKVKQWDSTNFIRTRKDVETFRNEWETLLENVILEVNTYFVSGEFHHASLGDVISESTLTTLITRNKNIIAEKLKKAAIKDAVIGAYIDDWWSGIKSEYENDETDKYKAYAKTIILNWSNRILFAHLIKFKQNGALSINQLSYEMSPSDANDIFKEITSRCDFYNIFSDVKYNDIIPSVAWKDFIEFSTFLKNNRIEYLNQKSLQNILEGSVATNKRAINGQYTTPIPLANLLVRLTVRDWSDNVLDCCCGTGTIPKAALKIKKSKIGIRNAIKTVWACDKYKYPLQVANISMTDSESINLANRLFQHNALTLETGEKIQIINPETGEMMNLNLPSFGSVMSNLPFVPFEIIPDDDKAIINQIPLAEKLDGRSDLYCYIAAKIADVLKPGGMLGIIVSNSWLGTKAGEKLVNVLCQIYYFKQVHISGKGRWFKNADVVTTILILQKKDGNNNDNIDFWLWKKSLTEISSDEDVESKLVNSALLSKEIDSSIAMLSNYTIRQIEDLLAVKVSYNALFHNIKWLLNIKDKIIPINQVFHVFRGSRRGWDALFYPQPGEHQIENEYLKKVLINARDVTKLVAVADRDAFCCGDSISELEAKGKLGAIKWIEKFEGQKNGVGKPLPMVLKRNGMEWYELKTNEIAEIFTMMNPDKRLFFAKFETPSFVNQRLIGLKHRDSYSDQDLNHALLNSMVTMFYIEASGFGRGLGVLDVNKDSIANCYMLNPDLINNDNREKILDRFAELKARNIMKVEDELNDEVRLKFEHTVLEIFGIDEYFENIKASLLSMQKARATAKE